MFSWGFIKICDDNRMGAAIVLVFLCFLVILIIIFILFFNVFVFFHIFFCGGYRCLLASIIHAETPGEEGRQDTHRAERAS